MNIKVCTFNVRMNCKADGENVFPNRVPLIVKTLKSELPDIIGFQEVTEAMRAVLTDALPEYSFLGGGREKNRNGESSCIAFLRTKYVVCECETRWLSFRTKTPGSVYEGLDQSACPRVFTYALFTKTEGGSPFGVLNVHTDHVGVKARMLSSSAMLSFIEEKERETSFPFVITGDFNAYPDSDEIGVIKNAKGINEVTEGIGNTYQGFGKMTSHPQIDYIFASEDFGCVNVRKLEVCENGIYISDHYPVVADLTLAD